MALFKSSKRKVNVPAVSRAIVNDCVHHAPTAKAIGSENSPKASIRKGDVVETIRNGSVPAALSGTSRMRSSYKLAVSLPITVTVMDLGCPRTNERCRQFEVPSG